MIFTVFRVEYQPDSASARVDCIYTDLATTCCAFMTSATERGCYCLWEHLQYDAPDANVLLCGYLNGSLSPVHRGVVRSVGQKPRLIPELEAVQ